MISFYLAADYSRQSEMKEVRGLLEEAGYLVISQWLDSPCAAVGIGGKELGEGNEESHRLSAERNLLDLESVDEFILFTTGNLSRGGRHWETGYAAQRGIPIYIVGPLEHTFHCLRGIVHYSTLEEFLLSLKE